MKLNIYTKSRLFTQHIQAAVGDDCTFYSSLPTTLIAPMTVNIIHAVSFTSDLSDWLTTSHNKGYIIGIAADNPQVTDMLRYTEQGVHAFFNSFMSAPYYNQLLRLLDNGQSWYPPNLVTEAFSLARTVVASTEGDLLEILTKREREIALFVVEGKSNKEVASSCGITERTVKAHLTRVFKKLELKDRVSLVLYLKSG